MSAPFRIALFGGTFDPIHEGHLEIAEKAHTALSLDQVLFLPCRQSPHKKSGPLASEEDRLQMIKLATQELDWASVSDFELQPPILYLADRGSPQATPPPQRTALSPHRP